MNTEITEMPDENNSRIDFYSCDGHYKLGLICMQLGRLEDAIKELKLASLDKKRRMECNSLIWFCYQKNRNYPDAKAWIYKSLELTQAGSTEWLFFKYMLALTHEETKYFYYALCLYKEINKYKTGYKNVSTRISWIRNHLKKTNSFTGYVS